MRKIFQRDEGGQCERHENTLVYIARGKFGKEVEFADSSSLAEVDKICRMTILVDRR